MAFEGDVWRLERQNALLGEILIDEADFPWLTGRFVPAPGFDQAKLWHIGDNQASFRWSDEPFEQDGGDAPGQVSAARR